MCCLHLQGPWGINWGKEKCQQCRIIAKTVQGKGKGKVQTRTGHEVQEGSRFIGVLFLKPQDLEGICGQLHASGTLLLGRTGCPLCTKLDGP
jgi:hypothetical protein